MYDNAMVQVRAEVAERLDGLVSTIADLKSQFEGTIARVYLAKNLIHQFFSPQVGELERMGQGDREGVKLAFIYFPNQLVFTFTFPMFSIQCHFRFSHFFFNEILLLFGIFITDRIYLKVVGGGRGDLKHMQCTKGLV